MPRNSRKKQKSKNLQMAQNLNKEPNMATGGTGSVENQGEQALQFEQNSPQFRRLLMGQDELVNQPTNVSHANQNQTSYNNYNQIHSTQINGMQGMQGIQPYQPANPPYYNNVNNVVQQDGRLQTANHMNGNGNGNGTYDQSQVQMNNSVLSLMQQIQHTNSTVLSRLTAIEQSVSKLAPIEQNISALMTDVTNLKTENKHLSTNVCEVERSCQTISGIFDQFLESKSEIDTDISDLKSENKQLSEKLDQTCENLNKVSEELLDLKSKSMRENLLFFGLREINDSDEPGRPEDTEGLLRDFLKTEVLQDSQETVDSIKFDRVHRLGKYRNRGKPKPIVAKFERYSDREQIRKASFDLNKQRNGFSVREQFPFEIEQRRKELYPIMHEFRKNKENKVVLIKDKLFINDAQYIPEEQNAQSRETQFVHKSRQRLDVRKRVQVHRYESQTVQHQNRFHLLGAANSECFTPARSEMRTKQKARSPLEDESNKRSKSCQNETESESTFTPHSNGDAMEIPQNLGSDENDQNEASGSSE